MLRKGAVRRWGLWCGCGLLVLCLGGCGTAAPPAQQHGGLPTWVLNPAAAFKDPQAQALALAAQQGDVARINHLMRDEHVDPDRIFGKDEIPLLAWPILAQNPAGLKAMLDNGANPNARAPGHQVLKDASGKVIRNYCRYDSPMTWAARAESAVYLKLLITHGGNPNALNSNCESMLFQAFIWHGQWQNVQFLVAHGANVNMSDDGDPAIKDKTWGGQTILEDYTSYADFDKAWWLIQHGADPHWPRWKNLDGTPRYPVLEDIFWEPIKQSGWASQTRLQCWALQHGYKRPPMPDHYRKDRKEFGMPYEEKGIPLPTCSGAPASTITALSKERDHAITRGH